MPRIASKRPSMLRAANIQRLAPLPCVLIMACAGQLAGGDADRAPAHTADGAQLEQDGGLGPLEHDGGAVSSDSQAVGAPLLDAGPADDALPADAGLSTGDSAASATTTAGVWLPLGAPGVGGWSTSVAIDPRNSNEWYVGRDQLGLAVSHDGGKTWCAEGCSGITGSMSIEDFTWHPTKNEVWVATSSGPFVSRDDGRTWQWKRNGLGPAPSSSAITVSIQTIQFDPQNPKRMLAFAGNQRRNKFQLYAGAGAKNNIGTVWQSLDGGDSWSLLGKVTGSRDNISSATFLAGSSSNLLAAVQNKGIWRSTNGGKSWSKTAAGIGDGYDVLAHPQNGKLAWATGGSPNVVLRTTDGGASWSKVASGQAGFKYSAVSDIAVSADGSTLLFASKWGPLSRSQNGGLSFNHLWTGTKNVTGVSVFGGNLLSDVAISAQNKWLMLAAGVNEIIYSTDGGASWHDAITEAVGSGRYAGHGYSGLVCTDVTFSPLIPGDITLQTMDNGRGLTSKDGGKTWFRPKTSKLSGGVETVFSATDKNRRYALFGQKGWFGGLGISKDAGHSWTIAGSNAGLPAIPAGNNQDSGHWSTGIAVNPKDDRQVFAVINKVVYRSTNGASSFSKMGSGYVDVAFDDSGVLYAAGPAGVARATNPKSGGLTVIPGSPKPQHKKWSQLFVSKGSNPTVLVAAWGQGGFKYQGGSWSTLATDSRVVQLATHPKDPSIIVAVSGEEAFIGDKINASGVTVSFDGGKSFKPYNNGLRMPRVTAVAFDPFDPDRMIIGTHSGGFFVASFSKLTGH